MARIYVECEECKKRFEPQAEDHRFVNLLRRALAHEQIPLTGNDLPLGFTTKIGVGYEIVEGLSMPTEEHVQRYTVVLIPSQGLDVIFPYIPDMVEREGVLFDSQEIRQGKRIDDAEFNCIKTRLEYLVNEDIKYMLKEKRAYCEERGINFVLKDGKLGLTNKL